MIPFTADAYSGLMAQYNAAIWPAQLIALLLGAAALGQALRGGRFVVWILAVAWLWTGVAFLGLRLSSLVWAAWAFGALFALQGLLLVLAGLRGTLRFESVRGPVTWMGLAIAGLALVIHPAAAVWAGQDWASLPPFILAPAPLTLFTMGLLLLAAQPAPRHLLIVPTLWSAIAGAVAWELGTAADLALPLTALVTLGVSLRAPR